MELVDELGPRLIGEKLWEANVDPQLKAKYFRPPAPVRPLEAMLAEGYTEYWISYRNPYFAAKELTVLPGRSATIYDSGAYGLIVVQGHGTLGGWQAETPTLIRFGQLTSDEFFVSEPRAKEGVRITNPLEMDPLVMLKHFGPNTEAERV